MQASWGREARPAQGGGGGQTIPTETQSTEMGRPNESIHGAGMGSGSQACWGPKALPAKDPENSTS